MAINKDENKIRELLERGVEEVIDKNHLEKQLLSGKKLRIKFGIDPTGPKIHIGRAIVLWKLRAFQELNHQIVLIIGDATAQIGDASDKQEARKQLTKKDIKENMKDYVRQLGMVLDISQVELRCNSEWLSKITWLEGLELSKNFTAQQVIQRRNFKERWNQKKPIGLHELSYPLLQGTDSVAIKADVELGGYDQLFNLKTGREIQRLKNQEPQDIMTLKMLNGLDGRKMSTSWGNVINITDDSQDMFGKIMSMKDDLIGDYFEFCTNLVLPEIKRIQKEVRNPRDRKAILAKEIVKLYHGQKTAQRAEDEFNKVFRRKELPSKIPVFKTTKKVYPIMDLLKDASLVASKSEAKRVIKGGGVKINNKKEDDWKITVSLKDGDVVQIGKRKFAKIKVL